LNFWLIFLFKWSISFLSTPATFHQLNEVQFSSIKSINKNFYFHLALSSTRRMRYVSFSFVCSFKRIKNSSVYWSKLLMELAKWKKFPQRYGILKRKCLLTHSSAIFICLGSE
jgi:hypothetical protein